MLAKRPLFLKRWLIGFIGFLFDLSVRSTVYGSARWMTPAEEHAFFSASNEGLVLGKYRLSLKESYKNLAIFAKSGFGKTTRYIIQNVLNCLGSVVVTDPSGEIFDNTAGHMKRRGYKINVIRPHDPTQSHKFNALIGCDTPQRLRQLASTLADQVGGDPFWIIGATDILYIGLIALSRCDNPAFKTLGNLRWLLNHIGVDGNAINAFMVEHLDDLTFAEYKAFMAQDDKVLSSMLSTARAALNLWSDPNIVELTSAHDIDIDKLRTEKTITYLIVPEHRVKYFSLIIGLFYTACFESCLEMGDRSELLPLYFFLDEFGNLGKIPEFATIATTLRKRRCSISIVLQAMSQLNTTYGSDQAETIFSGGMSSSIFLAGLGLEPCEYLEKVLGKNTVYDTATGGMSESARTLAQPLMSSDEIRMMPEDDAVLISGRERPVKLQLPPFFHDPHFKRLSEIPAPAMQFYHPPDSVQWIPFDAPGDP